MSAHDELEKTERKNNARDEDKTREEKNNNNTRLINMCSEWIAADVDRCYESVL